MRAGTPRRIARPGRCHRHLFATGTTVPWRRPRWWQLLGLSGWGRAKAAPGAMREERGHYSEGASAYSLGEGIRPTLDATVRHAQAQRICHRRLPARLLAERVVCLPPKGLGLGTSRPSFAQRSGGTAPLPDARLPRRRLRRRRCSKEEPGLRAMALPGSRSLYCAKLISPVLPGGSNRY